MRKGAAPIGAHEKLQAVEHNHPLARLLACPNPYDTNCDLWVETVLFLDLCGAAYWWLPKNQLGLPAEIWVIPSHWVWAVPGKDRMIEEYQIRPLQSQQVTRTIPPDEVLQFRRPSPLSKVDGTSRLTEVSTWIDGYESLDSIRKHTMRNGTRPGLVVELDADTNDPDDTLIDRYNAKFAQRYQGEHRSGLPMWVPPGAKVKPWTLSPLELDFKGGADQYRDYILAAYGVPPAVAMAGGGTGTYGSNHSEHRGFYCFTINPLLRFFGRRLSEKLCPLYPVPHPDARMRCWFPDGTPDDPEQRETELQNDAKTGTMTVNEYRARRGMAPLLLDGGELDPRGRELVGAPKPRGEHDRKPNYDGGDSGYTHDQNTKPEKDLSALPPALARRSALLPSTNGSH